MLGDRPSQQQFYKQIEARACKENNASFVLASIVIEVF